MASTDNTWQELQARYAAMVDTEVEDLYERREDLTEIAREALEAEFRKRHLVSHEPVKTLQETSATSASIVHLWDFTDSLEASESVRLLEKNEVEASLRPIAQGATRGDGTPLLVMQLYVAASDADRAVQLLRKHKGLFPLPEQNADANYEPGDADLFVIAELDSIEDADLVEREFRAQQIAFRKSEEQRDGGATWIFEVAQNDVDRAGDALEVVFRDRIDGEAED